MTRCVVAAWLAVVLGGCTEPLPDRALFGPAPDGDAAAQAETPVLADAVADAAGEVAADGAADVAAEVEIADAVVEAVEVADVDATAGPEAETASEVAPETSADVVETTQPAGPPGVFVLPGSGGPAAAGKAGLFSHIGEIFGVHAPGK